MNRAETRSISIAAPPEAVLGFVSHPPNLPRWAPAFAPEIRRSEDGRWLIPRPDCAAEGEIVFLVSEAAGTLDILAAADRRRGARTRVLPNDAGSEYLFTLFFAPDAGEAEVAAQMATVDEELAAVRAHCERT